MRRLKKFQNPAGTLGFVGWDPKLGYIDVIEPSVITAQRSLSPIKFSDNTPLNIQDNFAFQDDQSDLDSDIDKTIGKIAKRQLNRDLLNFGGDPMTGLANVGGIVQNVSNLLAPAIKRDNTGYSGQQAIARGLNMLGPYGKIAGGIYSGLSTVAEAAGLNSNLMTKQQSSAAGITGSQRFWNNVASLIPFAGLGKGTQTAYKSDIIDQMSSAFGGTVEDINTSLTMGNQKYAVGRGQANDFINTMNQNNDFLTRLNMTSTLLKNNTTAQEYENQYYNKIYGNNKTFRVKNGMKLLSREELDKIYHIQDITKYQNGGSILIPDGELHAHKHHMDDVNPELAEDLTKKGIPVITTNENSEIEQVAEIEKEEIILEKSLTDKIEELRQENTDESAIEAGKLIVETLFTNCDDNADLIKEVE